MSKKRKNIKWLIVVEAIVFYFAGLNVISYARGPERYVSSDDNNLLLQMEDFLPLSAEEEKTVNDMMLINDTQGTAVGYTAGLQLTNLDKIIVSFRIDCPTEFAGGTIFVDLCNGGLGYDNPEQECSIRLESGENDIQCYINKGANAPSEAQFRIFTLDKANYLVEELKIEKAIPAPLVTPLMIWAVVLSGIVLIATIVIAVRKKHYNFANCNNKLDTPR